MATIANPVGAFDFAHSTDLSGASYSFDPLDSFNQDPSSSTPPSDMDPNFLQYYMTRPNNPTSQPTSTASQTSAFAPQATPATSYPFGQVTPATSTASENQHYAFTSSMSSPDSQFPPFGTSLSDLTSSTDYMSSAPQSAFSLDQFDPDFTNYNALLAGERQSGFVGEWQTSPQSTSAASQNLFSLSFPSQQSGQDPTPFKKPKAKASVSSSMSNSPSDASPSFQKALWQSSSASAAALRRPSSYSQQHAVQGPRSVPQSPQAATSQGQDWMQPAAALQSQDFLLPDSQFFHSPIPTQEPYFPSSSPQAQQSQYFHQTSDPSLLQPGLMTPTSLQSSTHGFPQQPAPASPALSQTSSHGLARAGSNHLKSSRSQSPYLASHQWNPYPRRSFVPSTRSESGEVTDSEREKNRCPHPECGKIFKDLKAHMLTHQNERPEKCPIPSCEYSKKGFSRKYDKNRHTLTHYKGTMVCGFCPGQGSSQEKSFNRADVFKRHLTTVHSVEQNPPNSRKKPSATAQARSTQSVGDATGECSICHSVFSNAQDFYEHLEDCVLSVVQKTDPSEAINEQLLTSVADDENVKQSLERQNLPTTLDTHVDFDNSGDEEEEEDDDDEEQLEPSGRKRPGQVGASHVNDKGAISKPSGGRRGPGLTWSKGGVSLKAQGRKRRKNYPNSWGCNADKMKMKKRVMTVWDGQRRLAKDDMMLHTDHEVRLPLPDAGNGAYVTDLDVQTLRRADGFCTATEDERGPWEQCVTNMPDGSMIGLAP